MILIGQYDSPFVRRVGITLRLYGIAFDHRPLSAFSDTAALAALNPLLRVPALVLPDGFVLADSHMILDYLDGMAAAPLLPRHQPARRRALQIVALACGVAEKAVSLFYEQRMHDVVSPQFDQRCREQITATLATLDADFAARRTPFWLGSAISHADIATACAWRFIGEAHPDLLHAGRYPALADLCARLESLPVFGEIAQGFRPPQ